MLYLPTFRGKKSPSSEFAGTMIEMNYLDIEQAALGGAAILFPISGIEEYGPHLPIGTNTYLTLHLCKKINAALAAKGKHALIAPPLYWGRNQASGSFTGSFNLRSQTMIGLLLDILADFKRWGFPKIYLINLHGDSSHNSTLIQAIRQARQEAINVYYVIPDKSLTQYGLTGAEEYLMVYSMPSFAPPSAYVDLHAGAFETSWMSLAYPRLVNQAAVQHLQPTNKTVNEVVIWAKGWDEAKRAFPLGYCGDPANIDIKKAAEFENKLVEEIAGVLGNAV